MSSKTTIFAQARAPGPILACHGALTLPPRSVAKWLIVRAFHDQKAAPSGAL